MSGLNPSMLITIMWLGFLGAGVGLGVRLAIGSLVAVGVRVGDDDELEHPAISKMHKNPSTK